MRGYGGEDFRAENLTGGITLGIFYSTTIAGGEEQYVFMPKKLSEAMLEIASLFSILKHENQSVSTLGSDAPEQHRGAGAQQALKENRLYR